MDSLVGFSSWREVLDYAQAGGLLYYKAPLDHRPTPLRKAIGDYPVPLTYAPRARTIKIWPHGSVGRGRNRTADPFTADSGHLGRFSRPDDQAGARVHEAGGRQPTSQSYERGLAAGTEAGAKGGSLSQYNNDLLAAMNAVPADEMPWAAQIADFALGFERGYIDEAKRRKTWFKEQAVNEAGHRRSSMTYGELPSFEEFARHVHTTPDPENPGSVYWPPGTFYPMELVGAHEIGLADGYGLDEFEVERARTGRNSRVRGFQGDEAQIYGFLEYLVDCFNDGDEEAGDLASSIMTTLGYEWI